MLYLYDQAIVNDLIASFNPNNVPDPVVKVIDPEHAIELAAQMQEGNIGFPIVVFTRSPNSTLDAQRVNFSRSHFGVQSVIDPKTNEVYYEKTIPIDYSGALTILTTNTVDMDEIVKELLFKYTSMYFLAVKVPYEYARTIRFGVTIPANQDIQRSSGAEEYFEKGQLYQTIIPLKIDGCVLVSYTPAKLVRTQSELNTID